MKNINDNETTASSNESHDCEMTGNDSQIDNQSFIFPNCIIEKKSYMELYYCLQKIFLQMQDETNKYILSFIPKMIENNISYEYSVANFENIINYTKKISENYSHLYKIMV